MIASRKSQLKKGGVYLTPKVEPLFTLPLQARHWKLAIQQSTGIVERWWRFIQTEAAAEIRKRDCWDNFNEPERHYVARMLCSVTALDFDLLPNYGDKNADQVQSSGKRIIRKN